MSSIRPVGSSQAQNVVPIPLAGEASAPVEAPGDAFAYTAVGSAATPDPMKAFWKGSQALSQALAMQGSLTAPVPLMTEKSAGWQAKLFNANGGGCYVKVPLEGESVLVVPLQQGSGGAFGVPVVADAMRGLTATPDVQPFGGNMCFRAEKSADGQRIYLHTGITSNVRIYDSAGSPGVDIDLAAIDADYDKLREFHGGRQADFAFMTSKTGEKGYLVALDTRTHQPQWTRPIDSNWTWGMTEDPQGNLCVVLDRDSANGTQTHEIRTYSPTGDDLGAVPTADTASDLIFRHDGLMVFNNGRSAGVKAMTMSGPGQYTEKWSIPDKNYRDFRFSDDGRFIYAIDPMNGFSRCHVLVKIDAETGKVAWERRTLGEHFVDLRVVGDDVSLLTSGSHGAERDVIHMRRLDATGAVLWEDSPKLSEMDEYDEGMRGCITPEGNFVFGGVGDGNLYFLHPRKAGETEDSIKQALDHSADTVADAKKKLEESVQNASAAFAAQAPAVEVHDEYILVNGVRLPKRVE